MKNNDLNLKLLKSLFFSLKKCLLVLPVFALATIPSFAQCPAGNTEITMEFGSGTFNNEASWQLIETTSNTPVLSASPLLPGTSVHCVPDGNYDFYGYDSFGDGWNGATVKITSTEDYSANGCSLANQSNPPGTVVLPTSTINGSFQILPIGNIGCIAPPPVSCPPGETQLNLNFGSGSFNDEISWELVETETNTIVASESTPNFSNGSSLYECVPDGNYNFNAYDSFGDGWNGATVEIIVTDDYSINGCNNPYQPTGTVVLPSTVPGGSLQVFPLGDIGCDLPSITISDVSLAEGNWWGVTVFKFDLTRSEATDACSVDFATSDGTAMTSDNDYNPLNGTVTWSNGGSDVKSIWVTVRKDNKAEPDESFFVNLSNPVDCAIDDGTGEGTIINDDGAPVIGNDDPTQQSYVNSQLTEGEISIYPNPGRDIINVNIPSDFIEMGAVQVSLIDKAGKEIQTLNLNNNQNQIEISELPQGVYNLVIQNAQGQKTTKKFLKIN